MIMDITDLLLSVKNDVSSRVDDKYRSILIKKRKHRAMKIFMLPFYPVLVAFNITRKIFRKVVGMKKIGFPFRYLRILSKLVSYVKRIEELEKRNARLEKELLDMKKQWFSGKV